MCHEFLSAQVNVPDNRHRRLIPNTTHFVNMAILLEPFGCVRNFISNCFIDIVDKDGFRVACPVSRSGVYFRNACDSLPFATAHCVGGVDTRRKLETRAA